MPVNLPLLPGLPNYQFRTELDGREYVFNVRWNQREEFWYVDAALNVGENLLPLFRSRKVALGTLIGGRDASEARLPGALIASDLSGKGEEAGLGDLGDRVRVYFYTAEEIAAL